MPFFVVFIFISLFFKLLSKLIKTVKDEGFAGMINHPFLTFMAIMIFGSSGALIPILFILSIIRKSSKNNKKSDMKRKGASNIDDIAQMSFTDDTVRRTASNSAYTSANANTTRSNTNAVNSFGLPSSHTKRLKIISRFNKRYDLSLTDGEMNRIVAATYLSTDWARELCYMNRSYDTIYSWFATTNSWLKVYLHAFQVQTISSDFAMQEQIAFQAFDQIFSDVCSNKNLPLDMVIRKINEKYFTNFDETTFMIAYRFVESKGKRYPLSFNSVINNQQDIDDLLKKYETTPTQTPSH